MYLFEFCKFFKKLLKYFTYAVCDFCTPSAYRGVRGAIGKYP